MDSKKKSLMLAQNVNLFFVIVNRKMLTSVSETLFKNYNVLEIKIFDFF